VEDAPDGEPPEIKVGAPVSELQPARSEIAKSATTDRLVMSSSRVNLRSKIVEQDDVEKCGDMFDVTSPLSFCPYTNV
jgi:hypothetical protein